MFAVICGMSVRGATSVTYNGISYTIDETTRTAKVARQNNSSLSSVNIPGTIYYNGSNYTVKAIDDYAFSNCRSLTTAVLPSTISSIGNDAFYYCRELASVNIPEGVTSIGAWAFYDCQKLTSVTLPSTLTSLGQRAFEDCSSLTQITIPKGVTSLEDGVFDDCTNLQNVTLPNTLTSIGARAFWYCSNLQSINIPDKVTTIGYAAFSWCQKLTSITLPSKLKKIESSAFSCCKGLTSIVIPDDVRSIADNAFGATSLQSVTISKGVTYISPTAFQSCNLSSVTVAEGNPVFDSREGCNAIIETSTNRLILGTSSTKIPEGVIEIGPQAFSGCSSLISIELPTIRIIGFEAFSNCNNLESVTLGKNLAEIGTRAFSWCSKLTALDIPKSVRHIGGQAFQGCSQLQTVKWPDALNAITDSVFQNCTGLTSITIPSTVKRIGKSSFQGCTKLTSINIPSSVTSIDDGAFQECSLLERFEIPVSVTKLGKNVFSSCEKLSSLTVAEGNPIFDSREACNAVIETTSNTLLISCNQTTIPSSVTAIGDYAFQSSKITNLTLPEGLTTIGKYAFSSSKIASLTLPSTLTSIGDDAFSSCSSLTALVFPEGLQKIGRSAFFGSSLESVTLPSTLKEVGDNAFWANSSLKTVVLPASIERLASWTFISCRNIADVYCYRATPPTFGSLAFEMFTATLHVPAAAIEAYKADANWGKFSNIVAINEGSVTYSYDPVTLTATLEGYNGWNESQVILHSTTIYQDQVYQVKHISNSVFQEHSSLQSLQLPDSLESLGNNALAHCQSLRKITLPSSIRSLGSQVFSGCNSLSDIYCFGSDVPSVEGDIVDENLLPNITVHVPLLLISQYKGHEVWGKFGHIVPLEVVGQPTLYLEFFVDKDPGLGKGNRITIGKNVEQFSYYFYTDYFGSSSPIFHSGINNLGMRLISVNDDGSQTFSSTTFIKIYKEATTEKSSNVSYVEYFWDDDPGYGKGTSLPFTYDYTTHEAMIDTQIDQGNLVGEHTLFVRACAGGVWSVVESCTVVIDMAGPLNGTITLDPAITENQEEGLFSTLASLLSSLSTRGFDIGLNVNVADAVYNVQVSEQSIAVVQALYQYLFEKNFYISMKAQRSATFNFIMPEEFIYMHQEELPQIVAAVQALFSHIVTENISILINGQTYEYDGFQVEPNDLLALKNLYNRLGGENWTEKKWSFLSNGRDKDELPGVEFNDQGRVTSINLYNNNLKGVLSADWELNLPYLNYLNLSQNNIEGDLSPFLRYAASLKSLYMTNNCLTEISDTLPGSLQTIDLKYQFKTGYSNSELKESYLEKQQPRRFYISNKQQLALPSLFTYNHKYMDHSSKPTVYLLDNTSNHNAFAYYTDQYGFAWKSSGEYTDVQDARYLTEISGGALDISGSVIPMYVRYVEGDANMSGATDVLDVQHTLNRILGTAWNFNYSAANTYQDNMINVQDIVCTVNIVLDNESSIAREPENFTDED